MQTKKIECDDTRTIIARTILESLPDWFGIPEATEAYIANSIGKPFFCAYDKDRPVGFLYLKETGQHTAELAVMGVLKEYHRQGVGRKLFAEARNEAKRLGYSFIQVTLDAMYKSQSIEDFMRNSYAYCKEHETAIREHIQRSEE